MDEAEYERIKKMFMDRLIAAFPSEDLLSIAHSLAALDALVFTLCCVFMQTYDIHYSKDTVETMTKAVFDTLHDQLDPW